MDPETDKTGVMARDLLKHDIQEMHEVLDEHNKLGFGIWDLGLHPIMTQILKWGLFCIVLNETTQSGVTFYESPPPPGEIRVKRLQLLYQQSYKQIFRIKM